jgi:hypothetical protein
MEPIVIEAAAKRLESLAEYNLKEYFKAKMPGEGYQAMLKAIDEINKEAGISVRRARYIKSASR